MKNKVLLITTACTLPTAWLIWTMYFFASKGGQTFLDGRVLLGGVKATDSSGPVFLISCVSSVVVVTLQVILGSYWEGECLDKPLAREVDSFGGPAAFFVHLSITLMHLFYWKWSVASLVVMAGQNLGAVVFLWMLVWLQWLGWSQRT